VEARARRADKAEKGLVPRRAVRTRPRLPQAEWAEAEDEALLDLRLSELELKIEGSDLEERIAELGKELEAKGLQFRPHFWLADEWFCPDGVPGIAIPFYLAHPRLRRLELTQMLEIEGGTREWCMMILRHEAGHAIENAYKLRQRPKRQAIFGKSSEPYPDSYAPKPYSRSFVVHLDSWYAQSHPDEDFAETFAVWLTPDSNWRERYKGWPALRKLEYVDALMRQIAGRAPAVATRRTPFSLASQRRTLRVHYRRKRRHYRVDARDTHDRDLRALFSDAPEHAGNAPAAPFLTRIRREVRNRVRRWTGERLYVIDQVLGDMVTRCRELGLRLRGAEDEARLEFTTLLTARTMTHLQLGRHRVPL
jgi:Putative zinc-binding metallo-peptidase